jgi:predicted methyltransferase
MLLAPMRTPSVLRAASFTRAASVAAVSLVPLAAIAGGCGGGDPAPAFPQHLDIPVAPEPAGSQGKPATVADPAPAPVASAEPPKDDPTHPGAVALPIDGYAAMVVAAAGRTDADRALDAGRHPGELLTFLDLHPGMRLGELAAGGGYTTELLALAAGSIMIGYASAKPSPHPPDLRGKVWAENPPVFLKFMGDAWKERLTRPAMKNVVRADRELDSPFPPEAKNLDAVVSVLVYHDTVWMGVDRDKMNKAVFDALKKGGEYVVVDHSAAAGHGLDDVKTFHRIEESAVTREVLRAGFEQVASANFLRNPADARDWNDSPKVAGDRRGTSDRFVLKFVKP